MIIHGSRTDRFPKHKEVVLLDAMPLKYHICYEVISKDVRRTGASKAEIVVPCSKSLVEQGTALQDAEKRSCISCSRLYKTLTSVIPHRKDGRVIAREPVPELSLQRREASLNNKPFESESEITAAQSNQKTVLYLAYGSNLCYATFQGSRGIKPLSQMNVVVPELRMTFDLPGLPYTEPCFANSARRDPAGSSRGSHDVESQDYHKDRWKKGMVGVVYEVTPSDYAHIIATEGGGSSYHDIIVTCYPLSSKENVPDIPTTIPFKTHTLFAPPIQPSKPGSPDRSRTGRFQRPDPSYAQASARYLGLLTTGADEHNLPQEYKTYLHDLRPYTLSTQGQRLGQFIFLSLWYPFFVLLFSLNRKYQDKHGQTPKWLASLCTALFAAVWNSYDNIFKSVFGDGERTVPRKRGHERRGPYGRLRCGDEEWAPSDSGKMAE
ncbi:hypothetical protein EJ08DRAFT_656843 [Tothia fuscella]|uniref:gamma-glutamylcyclotransferase n=1 Tax=Tothia fuscella TaxID=1048955 RepID=A0A9P4NZ95_9PEZI|nr:hypothetical protein EJ08DRAFT_656843 [Tothia fuscella]